MFIMNEMSNLMFITNKMNKMSKLMFMMNKMN